MMISGVSVGNFKCFRRAHIALAPLTLLTGFNAAGKSSAIQPLLLLAQSLRRTENRAVLDLNGALVRLGSIGDVLPNQSRERYVSIAVHCGSELIEWRFEASTENTNQNPRLTEINVTENGVSQSIRAQSLAPRSGIPKSLKAVVPLLRSTCFISATRGGTSEIAPSPVDATEHVNVGVGGEYAAWWYANAADDEIPAARRHPKEDGTTLRRQLDAYMSELFPGAQANAEAIPRTQVSRLEFRSSGQSSWRRPANIGYGLSYAFPLLVALLLVPKGQLVVIDSPEAHLHPHAQSTMGKILGRFAAAGVQIIIETHSDHVLNGVRLAVCDQTLAPSHVAIHFFTGAESDEEGAVIASPVLNAHGAMSDWPKGFFDQSEIDLLRISGMG